MKITKKLTAVFCAAFMIFSLTACQSGTNSGINSSIGSTDSTVSGSASVSETAAQTDASKPEQSEASIPMQSDDETSSESTGPSSLEEKSNVLVAYFSCTGNTEKLAKYAAEITGGTLYEIVPAVPYTDADRDWNNSGSRTSIEMNDTACRPEISGRVDNFGDYDVLFIAYPIWWGQAPRIRAFA